MSLRTVTIASVSAFLLHAAWDATNPPAAAVEYPTCPHWNKLTSTSYPVKVWVCSLTGPTYRPVRPEDQSDLDGAQRVMDIISSHWDAMTDDTNGMGAPLGDSTGRPLKRSGWSRGDELDYYIFSDTLELERRNDPGAIGTGGYPARAVPIEADGGVPGRGFVVVEKLKLNDPHLEQFLVHETFHVLQYRWGQPGMSRGTMQRWFTEASATWAETFFIRDKSRWTHDRWYLGRQDSVPSGFQFRPELSLLDPTPSGNHMYRVYPWVLFMEQELGGGGRNGKPIFNAWKNTRGLRHFDAIHALVDRTLPFKTHFRDFAVRNLDDEEMLSSANEKRFSQLDPNFPRNEHPTHTEHQLLPDDRETHIEADTLRGLVAHYAKFVIQSGVKRIDFDLTPLSSLNMVDFDAVVHLENGKWQPRKLDHSPKPWCLDRPEDKITDFWLVLGNHDSRLLGTTIGGHYIVHPRTTPCDELRGESGITIKYDFDNPGGDDQKHLVIRLSAAVTWDAPRGTGSEWLQGRWNDSSSTWTISGYDTRPGCRTTYSGTGKFNINGTDAEYNVRLLWKPPYSPPRTSISTPAGIARIPDFTTYGGINGPPSLAVHLRTATAVGNGPECGSDEGKPVETEISLDGCRIAPTPDTPLMGSGNYEGRMTQTKDGYLLNFDCTQSETVGGATTRVAVKGSLPIRIRDMSRRL